MPSVEASKLADGVRRPATLARLAHQDRAGASEAPEIGSTPVLRIVWSVVGVAQSVERLPVKQQERDRSPPLTLVPKPSGEAPHCLCGGSGIVTRWDRLSWSRSSIGRASDS